jgi:hypothetical protein
MTASKSMTQKIYEFCRDPRTVTEISTKFGMGAANNRLSEMTSDGVLKRLSRGVYIRTDKIPMGRNHGTGKGKDITIGNDSKQRFCPSYSWQPPPHVAMMGNVCITVAPTPRGRYEVIGKPPRTFELEIDRRGQA